MSRNDPATTPKRPGPSGKVPAAGPPRGGTLSAADREAIEAVLRGDIERYAELVNRYRQTAWKLAYSLIGNFEDARELSQNSFVKAYRHLRRFRKQAAFSTWLYRIVLNECRDFFRRKARQPEMFSLSKLDDEETSVFEPADPGSTPRDAAENRALAAMLTKLIRQLPKQQQTAFVLHQVHGFSLEETARVMGCRAGTVKAHLFRAMEKLRLALTPVLEKTREEH